jgi:hypothetical protein
MGGLEHGVEFEVALQVRCLVCIPAFFGVFEIGTGGLRCFGISIYPLGDETQSLIGWLPAGWETNPEK